MTSSPENSPTPLQSVNLLDLFVHRNRDKFKVSQLALDDIVSDPKLRDEIQALEPTVPLTKNTIYITLSNLRYSMRGGWGFVMDSDDNWSIEIPAALHEALKVKLEEAGDGYYSPVFRGD